MVVSGSCLYALARTAHKGGGSFVACCIVWYYHSTSLILVIIVQLPIDQHIDYLLI